MACELHFPGVKNTPGGKFWICPQNLPQLRRWGRFYLPPSNLPPWGHISFSGGIFGMWTQTRFTPTPVYFWRMYISANPKQLVVWLFGHANVYMTGHKSCSFETIPCLGILHIVHEHSGTLQSSNIPPVVGFMPIFTPLIRGLAICNITAGVSHTLQSLLHDCGYWKLPYIN